MTGRRAAWRWGCGLVAAVGVADAARAEPARLFRLPSEPVDTALVRFAVQGGVSVGGFPAPGCAGPSRPVIGLMTPSAALHRLLPAGCGFTRLDARAFRIEGVRDPVPARPATVAGPPPSAVDLGELVVTAEKRTEPLRGSPFAVTALDGDTIDRLGAKSFADLAAQAPAVAETNLGPGRNKLFIRGLSDGAFTGRTQSTVGLYFDDTPISYNAPDPDLRLTDIAQVEVLRGPQGTLYGSGSIGGIVRLVPRAPDPTGYAAWIQGEAVMNEHKDRSFGGEAMLNAPLLGGRAAVRAVGYVEELAGYLDNPVLGLEDVNHGKRRGGRIAGLVDLGDGWQARAGWIRQDILTADSQYTQGGGVLSRDARILEPHDNDFTQYAVSVNRQGSRHGVRMSAAYIDHDLATRYDATGAFDLPAGRVAAFDEAQRVELVVAEAVVTSNDGGRLRWLAGAFGSSAIEKSGGVLDEAPSGGGVRSLYARRDRLKEAAVFGEVAYDLTPQVTLILGGRLFATRVETWSGAFELATAPIADVTAHLTDEGFAPKARLSYAVSPDLVVYAQAQDGYRAGGFNVPAAADGVAGGPAVGSFRPDRLRSYEAGGEARLFDGRLTLRAAVYKAVWTHVQTDQFRPSGLPLTVNIGDGSNRGAEFEAVWRPDQHWRLRISGLFNSPELTRTDDVFPAKVDVGLPGVANRTFGADITYGRRLSPDWRAELTAQAAYVGRSFLTFDGASASAMGDYAQGRVAARLEGRHWEAEAYVANVTDERGNTFAYGNPFSRTRAVQATPLPPRTYGLALRRRF